MPTARIATRTQPGGGAGGSGQSCCRRRSLTPCSTAAVQQDGTTTAAAASPWPPAPAGAPLGSAGTTAAAAAEAPAPPPAPAPTPAPALSMGCRRCSVFRRSGAAEQRRVPRAKCACRGSSSDRLAVAGDRAAAAFLRFRRLDQMQLELRRTRWGAAVGWKMHAAATQPLVSLLPAAHACLPPRTARTSRLER